MSKSVLIISLDSAFQYLKQQLSYGMSDEVYISSILHLLAHAVVKIDDAWSDVNTIEKAYEAIQACPNVSEEKASEICRNTDALIRKTILEHLPNYGKTETWGKIKYEFINDYEIKITIDQPSAI